MKGMQNHIWSFLFNQFFLFLRLSVLADCLSLCLYLITLPSCSDLLFLNFELKSPGLLSFKEVIFHTGGSTLESVNTPFKHARIKKIEILVQECLIYAYCIKLNLVLLQWGGQSHIIATQSSQFSWHHRRVCV